MTPNTSPLPVMSLDPEDWDEARIQAHRMLDDMLDYVAHIRERPVWTPMPQAVRDHFRAGISSKPVPLQDVHREFMEYVVPYAGGNVHPGFMGWVQGGGTVAGMLAEMLAGGLNANLGGRDHAPIEVERQVLEWVRRLFGFPEGASGLFVTGTSMANLLAVLAARTAKLGKETRHSGLGLTGKRLRAYASDGAHGCVAQALDLAGFGKDALRLVPTDADWRMDMTALRAMIARDRAAGLQPFLVVGSAGTVDVGAIDDLRGISDLCREQELWFHIDGAYGALGMLSPAVAPPPCWTASARPIPSPSIFTSGARSHTTQASSWFATGRSISRPLHRRPRICAGNVAAWPPAAPGPAISAPIFRGAFAPSRPGSRSRYMVPRRSGQPSPAAANLLATWQAEFRPNRSLNSSCRHS